MSTKTKTIGKKQQEIKKQYMKERRRIQSWIRRAEKRGYTVNYNLPAIPKKLTQASINRLAKMDTEKLYSKSTYVKAYRNETTKQFETKVISGKEARAYERKVARVKGQKTKEFKRKYGTTPKEYYGEDVYYKSDAEKLSDFTEHLKEHFPQSNPNGKPITGKQFNVLDKMAESLAILAMQLENDYGSGAGDIFIEELGLLEVYWAYKNEAMTQNIARAMEPLHLSKDMQQDALNKAYEDSDWDLEYYNINVLDNE